MEELRVVAGVIVREGRVLVALRGPGMRLAGEWEFPGGKVEPGEDDATALARELREELGVDVRVGPLIGVSRHPIGARLLVLVAYRCALVAGEPSPVEHAEVRWVAPEGLSELAFAAADRPLLGAVADSARA